MISHIDGTGKSLDISDVPYGTGTWEMRTTARKLLMHLNMTVLDGFRDKIMYSSKT